ncbi:MAG: hypothetical protein NVSMB49_28280 [Ktedonobacteraceae bacterium]
MSEQQHQQGTQIPIYDAQEPSEKGKHVNTVFDDLEAKQLDTLDEAGKNSIERIATFLGVLFAVTVLSSNFPPPYLKGNVPAKVMIITSLVCFLLSIGAGLLVTQVRSHPRYYNQSKNVEELKRMIGYKLLWSRVANLLFALGAIALAGLLIVIIWNL